MLKIKNTQVFGLERAIKASGNAMTVGEIDTLSDITESDNRRGVALGNHRPGQAHDNYLKGIIVQADIKYPQYWSMEAQRYHWFEIITSQSKMHRIVKAMKEPDPWGLFNEWVDLDIVNKLKEYAKSYEIAETDQQKYFWFMKIISNCPLGYEHWMTVTTNYLQLKGMYLQRKGHKLKYDWGAFCEWCLQLPRFAELTGVLNGNH